MRHLLLGLLNFLVFIGIFFISWIVGALLAIIISIAVIELFEPSKFISTMLAFSLGMIFSMTIHTLLTISYEKHKGY